MLQNFYCGLSGLQLPIPKYKFPEPFQSASRLSYYSSFFNSIEVNSTFYALPQGKTLIKWSHEVSDNFKFTFKLWKQITHTKSLEFQESDVQRFFKVIEHVGDKKGSVLIQFPASVKSNCMPQLDRLLYAVSQNNIDKNWNVAVEFRDRSWYGDETYDLLGNFGCTMALHDKSGAGSPHLTSRFDTLYVRFHGPQGNYRGTYSEAFLYEYANYVCEWIADGKLVYVYFNNTAGTAFHDSRKFSEYVKEMEHANR